MRSRQRRIGQVWTALVALAFGSCTAAFGQTFTCPTGQYLGPWKITQSYGTGSFSVYPYGPCSVGENFGSVDAAVAACTPTGVFGGGIVWEPPVTVSYIGSLYGDASESALYSFSENSYFASTGRGTVVEFLGRVGAACTTSPYFIEGPGTTPSRADAGVSCPACRNPPDPVNPSSGSEFIAETDIEPIGARPGLSFSRYYSSVAGDSYDMGPGWSRTFSRRLIFEYSNPTYAGSPQTSSLYSTQSDACTSGWAEIASRVPGYEQATATYSNGTCTLSLNGTAITTVPVLQEPTPGAPAPTLAAVEAYRDDGHVLNFTASGSAFAAEPGVADQLVGMPSGGYQLTDDQDNVETYDSTGKLLSVADRAGTTLTLTYDTTVAGLLSSVTDNFGHSLTFTFNGNRQLVSVTAPDGSSVQYTFDGSGRLSTITNLDGSTRQYNYTDANWSSGISSVVDESAQTEFNLSYDAQGRVTSSTLGGVSSSMSFAYNSDGSTTETDPLGAVRTFQFQQIGNHELSSAVTGAPCFKCGYVAATSHDGGGFPASATDFNGNVATYVYDDTRGLETSRTEASGTAIARTITTQWNSTYHLPALISEYAGGSASGTPIRTTAFNYDGTGNLLTKTITDPATGSSRTWSYTYDSYGRILTADGPRTDVSDVATYAYYTCATGSQCGQLETITDAFGHVTTYNTYDADGRPLTITDPNGVVTTLTYDARGHMKSRSVGAETTSFSYYPTGLLEQLTLPDGSSLSYTYDAAHRLTQVSDRLGNKIIYTLDAMGNRTAENSYDPSGTLHRTHARVINTLNEVYQEVNAAGTSAVTTTFGYDNDGNLTSIQAPLSRNTSESYDALNRVSSTTDPGNGITAFAYDAEDNITSVTDPRNLTTSYSYNGLGDLTSQVSPDTGTTTNTYDSAGNLATSTDARGAVATYGYDALNRVTTIAYSLNGTTDQTLSFTYDQGSDGIGHLTGVSDANHSASFSYDALGEMTGMSQTAAGITRSISYGYTNGDVTSMTTPSGQTVTYGYNADHEVTSIGVNGTTVLSNVAYEPFGPVDGWTWGNGSAFSRTFNGDGLITGISSPGIHETLSYDDASRISGISNTASGASSWTYGYDQLDRLTSATSSSITQGWTYDADGNRLTETGNFYPSSYVISPSSNRITQITGALAGTSTYDAVGNLASFGSAPTTVYTYNDRGRMSGISYPGGYTETLAYDAFGRLIFANGASQNESLVYDQSGHLLGEYDLSGNLIQETVWLGDIPVATLQPNGSGGINIYYVHTDQLDTPRAVTRPSDNAMVWQWDSDPFGATTPNENPSGLGTFGYNLRFPGQILSFNGARIYDSAIGRYDESDPIGLAGGNFSTYAYVKSDPLTGSDPLGLAGPPDRTAEPTYGFPGALDFPLDPSRFGWPDLAWQQINQWMESAGQTLDNILQMAKGGDQNQSNEYSRAAVEEARTSGKDPCDLLDEWYKDAKASGDSVAALKIQKAQKALGCRNRRKRCP